MNGNKWSSRSFLIEMTTIVCAFGLSFYLKDATAATVIVPVVVGSWFAGKAAAGFTAK